MKARCNDLLRFIIGLTIKTAGAALQAVQYLRILAFAPQQARLRRRYKIGEETPILGYGPEIERQIQEAASRAEQKAGFAETSGSTGHPKRILYTNDRLRSVKWTFMEMFARCCWAFRLRRASLFVFSALDQDNSLTSMLLKESGAPGFLAALQAPYRVQFDPAIRGLAANYGTNAVRLWILAIANPGVLYSTNPSTISTFLDDLKENWKKVSSLVSDFVRSPEHFQPAVHRIARRFCSRGSRERFRVIARSEQPLELGTCAPGIDTYICWTGGYVQPFLDRIALHLPRERYRLVPMYSMSTETIETLPHFYQGRVTFHPVARGVLYEFIEDPTVSLPETLLLPHQLERGKTYTMVVSDAFGLRRYQTGDLFLCNGQVHGLPDLQFLRRNNLEYSFTGEKITGEQVAMTFEKLRTQLLWLQPCDFLTCIPSKPSDEAIPHYKIVLLGKAIGRGRAEQICARFDVLLSEMNSEYRSRRESQRLGQPRFVPLNPHEFAEWIRGSQHRDTWQSQFKFLPLYRETWESLAEKEAYATTHY